MSEESVMSIVEDYLEKHRYDGLYHEDECGCWLGELSPGDCLNEACVPGVSQTDELGQKIIGPKP